MSVRRLLDWLEAQPGSTWQQRWQASGAEQAGKDWAVPLAGSGRRGGGTADRDVIKAGMMLLLAGQVIRPGLAWLLDQPYYKTLAVAFTQIDPAGLDALQREHAARGASGSIAAAAASGHWHVLAQAVLGGIALAGFYLVLALISPSGMGMGDVKAAAGLGTMLAWRAGAPSSPAASPGSCSPRSTALPS